MQAIQQYNYKNCWTEYHYLLPKVDFIQSIMLYLHSIRERYCTSDSISLLLVLKTPEENIWLLLLFGVFLSFFCFFNQKQCGGESEPTAKLQIYATIRFRFIPTSNIFHLIFNIVLIPCYYKDIIYRHFLVNSREQHVWQFYYLS